MTYRISISHEAEKVLDRLDRPTEQRIRARLAQLIDDPFDPRLSALLTGRAGVRKSRVGGWRLLFTVDRDARIVYVATIDSRGQIYKRK
ncbi:MAG: type II toxin-antitoxin system RelE family toxin [Bryobacteraceae bacterium]